MVQAPTQTNPNAKYEALTDIMLKETPERTQALDDRLTIAWANHIQANTADNGKGLGEAMYTAADNYVRQELYGITGALPGNANLGTQLDAIIAQTIGVTRSQLVDTYKDKKVVHVGDIEGVTDTCKKAMGKSLQGIQATRLKDLGKDDFEAFKSYVLGLAEEVGATNLKADKMPTLHAAIEEYMQMMPLLAQYRGLKKAAAERTYE